VLLEAGTCRWAGGVHVALLIFPIGIVLGWFVRPPRRAAVATQAVGFGALVVLSLLWGFGDVVVSPLETLVLVFGTPLAGVLASSVARWRLYRRRPVDSNAG
jgi:hypothetical protein